MKDLNMCMSYCGESKEFTWTSNPELTANVFGTTKRASAYAAMPRRTFPLTVSLYANSSLLAVTSKAPAPKKIYY